MSDDKLNGIKRKLDDWLKGTGSYVPVTSDEVFWLVSRIEEQPTRVTDEEWQAATDELFEALGEGYGLTRDHCKGLAFRVLTAARHPGMRAAAPQSEEDRT